MDTGAISCPGGWVSCMRHVIRSIEKISEFLGGLSGFTTLIITVTVILDIALRALLNAPIPGATEFSTLLLVALVYLGLASVQVSKSNFSVEIVVAHLPPAVRRVQEALVTLLSAAAIGLLVWYTGKEAWISTMRGEMTFGAIVFPVWPSRIIVTFGLTVLWLQLMCDALRLIFNGLPAPVGEDAEIKGVGQ